MGIESTPTLEELHQLKIAKPNNEITQEMAADENEMLDRGIARGAIESTVQGGFEEAAGHREADASIENMLICRDEDVLKYATLARQQYKEAAARERENNRDIEMLELRRRLEEEK